MSPVEFEIRVADMIPPEVLAQLPDIVVVAQPAGTVLNGTVVDRAAFYGVLNRIRGLGLPLIEARSLPDSHGGP